MPTLTIEVSDLVMSLRDCVETQFGGNRSAAARALGLNSRTRLVQWLDGKHAISLEGDRALQVRMAFLLGISPREVWELAGAVVSDDVPTEDDLASLQTGPYLSRPLLIADSFVAGTHNPAECGGRCGLDAVLRFSDVGDFCIGCARKVGLLVAADRHTPGLDSVVDPEPPTADEADDLAA